MTEKPLPHSLRIATEMGLDPSDPTFALVKAVDILQRQALTEMGILVSKLGDDIAATSMAAENAARAKAEQVITEAGEWAAAQIQMAGHTAAAEIREALVLSAAKPPAQRPWFKRYAGLGWVVGIMSIPTSLWLWWQWGWLG